MISKNKTCASLTQRLKWLSAFPRFLLVEQEWPIRNKQEGSPCPYLIVHQLIKDSKQLKNSNFVVTIFVYFITIYPWLFNCQWSYPKFLSSGGKTKKSEGRTCCRIIKQNTPRLGLSKKLGKTLLQQNLA